MKLSLRLKVVIPVGLLAIVLSAFASYTILASLERSLATSLTAQLRSSYLLLSSIHASSPRTNDSLSTILVWFSPSGKRIAPQAADVPALFRKLPEVVDDVPSPESFRDNPYVGLVLPPPGSSEQALSASQTGVLISTRNARRTYHDVQTPVLLLAGASTLLLIVAAHLVAGRLHERIARLR